MADGLVQRTVVQLLHIAGAPLVGCYQRCRRRRRGISVNSPGVANGRGSHGEANKTRATVTRPARWRIAAAALVGGLVLAACSSSTTSPPIQRPSPSSAPAATAAAAAAATPSAASAVCQAAAELRASVYALDHVTIGKGHAGAIKSDVANIEAKFTALTAAVRGGFKAQTSAVKTALGALKTAVSDLTAHPSAKAVAGVVTAASGVAAAVSSLLAALAPQCGSASPSP